MAYRAYSRLPRASALAELTVTLLIVEPGSICQRTLWFGTMQQNFLYGLNEVLGQLGKILGEWFESAVLFDVRLPLHHLFSLVRAGEECICI